jgi:hypothetical protein
MQISRTELMGAAILVAAANSIRAAESIRLSVFPAPGTDLLGAPIPDAVLGMALATGYCPRGYTTPGLPAAPRRAAWMVSRM